VSAALLTCYDPFTRGARNVIKITSQDDHNLTTTRLRNLVSCGNAKVSWCFTKRPLAKRRIREEMDSAPITR
jgi:hypothetical protein